MMRFSFAHELELELVLAIPYGAKASASERLESEVGVGAHELCFADVFQAHEHDLNLHSHYRLRTSH